MIIPDDAYGGTFRLIDKVWGPLGVSHTPVPSHGPRRRFDRGLAARNPAGLGGDAVQPALSIVDIAAVAAFAHERGAPGWWSTTPLPRPTCSSRWPWGADVVVHSTTKYLGGHSDVVGGFVATNDAELAEQLAFFQNAVGGASRDRWTATWCCGESRPWPCAWTGTAPTRPPWPRCCPATPPCASVLYPGLPQHPGHEVAAPPDARLRGMVSFVLAGGEAAALEVARSTRSFTLAESLGAVESLIEHPHRMTHASVADSPLAVDPGLVRLSVGLETLEDLLSDLSAALEKAERKDFR